MRLVDIQKLYNRQFNVNTLLSFVAIADISRVWLRRSTCIKCICVIVRKFRVTVARTEYHLSKFTQSILYLLVICVKLFDITQTAEYNINFTQTLRKCDFTQLFE